MSYVVHPLPAAAASVGREGSSASSARKVLAPGPFACFLLAPFLRRRSDVDRVFEQLLEGRGGTFTDALEREAERRLFRRD